MKRKVPISIDFGFCVFAVLLLMLVPLRLNAAFLLASFIHEFGHFIALKFSGVKVLAVRFHSTGIEMSTDVMTPGKELICALAGPISGFLLLPAARYMPYAALFAFGQSVFNLLPIFPMDGGRALKCIFCKLFGSNKGFKVFCLCENICRTILVVGAVYIAVQYGLYIFVLIILVTEILKLLGRKRPCKLSKQIVQ